MCVREGGGLFERERGEGRETVCVCERGPRESVRDMKRESRLATPDLEEHLVQSQGPGDMVGF